jgi:hypothetical protein
MLGLRNEFRGMARVNAVFFNNVSCIIFGLRSAIDRSVLRHFWILIFNI